MNKVYYEMPDLRARRNAVKLSGEKLSRMAGCSLASVYKIEYGQRATQQMFERIDAALRSVKDKHDPHVHARGTG